MSEEEVPEDVRKLLYEHVHTYEQLETLMALQLLPQRELSLEEIATAARLTAESATEALRELQRFGIVAVARSGSPPGYSRTAGDLEPVLDRLVLAYEEHRLEVIKLMNANAIERMRTGVLRAFSDAFVVGRKRGNR
ncbi:MAG TPA: hypothetical protein VMV45_12485 [Casimicrobiaceae bacterium]|nr:hypothetical protein [Casimicrobiaceae bacterium]